MRRASPPRKLRSTRTASAQERPAVVAGIFYPEEKRPLTDWVDQYLKKESKPSSAVALILPHGGDRISGEVVGELWGQVAVPKTVLLLGPSHTGVGARFSVVARGSWETPLGKLAIDEKLAQAVLKGAPDLQLDPKAQEAEHGIEVLLPFLQRAQRGTRFVPIALGQGDSDEALRIGTALARVIQEAPEPILVGASALLTRYESLAQAQSKDQVLLEQIQTLDGRGFLEQVSAVRSSMCGAMAVAVTLVTAQALGATQARVVAHRTSAEETGEEDSILSYTGIVLN